MNIKTYILTEETFAISIECHHWFKLYKKNSHGLGISYREIAIGPWTTSKLWEICIFRFWIYYYFSHFAIILFSIIFDVLQDIQLKWENGFLSLVILPYTIVPIFKNYSQTRKNSEITAKLFFQDIQFLMLRENLKNYIQIRTK